MIETFSGNSFAQQSSKEYQDSNKCSCGKEDWTDITWCTDKDKICPPEQCRVCEPSEACELSEERLKCNNCGEIREVK